jgi:hypothetical protein
MAVDWTMSVSIHALFMEILAVWKEQCNKGHGLDTLARSESIVSRDDSDNAAIPIQKTSYTPIVFSSTKA